MSLSHAVSPKIEEVDFFKCTLKHPSPDTKPAIHEGSIGALANSSEIAGLTTATVLGKASRVVPKFMAAFMFTISCKPSSVKWFLLLTNSQACLKSIKSDHF